MSKRREEDMREIGQWLAAALGVLSDEEFEEYRKNRGSLKDMLEAAELKEEAERQRQGDERVAEYSKLHVDRKVYIGPKMERVISKWRKYYNI